MLGVGGAEDTRGQRVYRPQAETPLEWDAMGCDFSETE